MFSVFFFLRYLLWKIGYPVLLSLIGFLQFVFQETERYGIESPTAAFRCMFVVPLDLNGHTRV